MLRYFSFILANLVTFVCFASEPVDYLLQYKNECHQGKVYSCLEAARQLEHSPEILSAKAFYDKACELGSQFGCKNSSRPKMKIEKADKDKKKCDSTNDKKSCRDYAEFMYVTYPQNETGSTYMMKVCNMNDADECFVAGTMFEQRKEYDKAYEVYTKACDMNQQEACRWAAYMELREHNNFEKAMELFRKACEQKKMETACYNGAEELMVRQKYIEAEKLMKRSVELKQRGAKYRLKEIQEFAVLEKELNDMPAEKKMNCELSLKTKFTPAALYKTNYTLDTPANKEIAKNNFRLLHRKRECGAKIDQNPPEYNWITDDTKPTQHEYKDYVLPKNDE